MRLSRDASSWAGTAPAASPPRTRARGSSKAAGEGGASPSPSAAPSAAPLPSAAPSCASPGPSTALALAPGLDPMRNDAQRKSMSLRELVQWSSRRDRQAATAEKKRREARRACAERDAEVRADAAAKEAGPGPALQVQVQVVGGQIRVNDASLTAEAQAKQVFTRVDAEDTATVNSFSFMKRLASKRWAANDTELFYTALSQFGTDFSLIAHLFPGRARRHLKNKFQKESRVNPKRVDAALRATQSSGAKSYQEIIAMLRANGLSVGHEDEPAEPEPAEGKSEGGREGEDDKEGEDDEAE